MSRHVPARAIWAQELDPAAISDSEPRPADQGLPPAQPRRTARLIGPEGIYEQIKSMAMTYRFRPGERLNEIELAKQLAVSRTPVREALSRLVTEGYLTHTANKGFSARPLDAKQVYDLYELRSMMESSAVALACERASDDELAALEEGVRTVQRDSRVEAASDYSHALEHLRVDENFHETIARLGRNGEYLRLLQNINGRIHYVRWIDMQNGRRRHTQSEHLQIARAIRQRDAQAAAGLIRNHISRRLDQIVDVIKAGYAEIYTRDVPPTPNT